MEMRMDQALRRQAPEQRDAVLVAIELAIKSYVAQRTAR